jgi:hypothetical protein
MMSLALGALLAVLALSGCKDAPETDLSVGEITISNIPKTYTDNKGEPQSSYKVYVNASNSRDEKEKHAAQGTFTLLEDDLSTVKDGVTVSDDGSSYTVTIKLYNPLPDESYKNADPDDTGGGEFFGTVLNFSIAISPKVAPSAEALFVKASMMPLDKSTSKCDFQKLSIDLWSYFENKVIALYDGIIVHDKAEGEEGGVGTGIKLTAE